MNTKFLTITLLLMAFSITVNAQTASPSQSTIDFMNRRITYTSMEMNRRMTMRNKKKSSKKPITSRTRRPAVKKSAPASTLANPKSDWRKNLSGRCNLTFDPTQPVNQENKKGKIVMTFTPVDGGTFFTKSFDYDYDQDIRDWKIEKIPAGKYKVTGTATYGTKTVPLYITLGFEERDQLRQAAEVAFTIPEYEAEHLQGSTGTIFIMTEKPLY